MKHYQLIDADTGLELETFHPMLIAITRGDVVLMRLLDRLGAEIVVSHAQATAAYRPATEFLGATITTYKALRSTLRQNPWIRTRRPRQNRLEVHAGDWMRHLRQRDAGAFAALGNSAEVVDAIAAKEATQDAIRRRKAGG